MDATSNLDAESLQIAQRWCASIGADWSICDQLGKGRTAPVFEVKTPDGLRALKIYSADFSAGKKGDIERKRIDQQLDLRGHDCPSLIQIYDGGTFEGRHFLLMGRAPGKELEKHLQEIPRSKIRSIVDQVAKAAIFLRSKGLCHRDIKAANIFVSEDFNEATLLDISVIRDITDPVGVGTDHDGPLPVLATARYSPPEYLFRLVEPGPDLWHALNIYQLGALLHDLIMREPLFQAEYLKSSENRYRFAWIIATLLPQVVADDVDQDLVFTAQTSLDKDWRRRSRLRLEDFLADSSIQRQHALELLGLVESGTVLQQNEDVASRLRRLAEVTNDLEARIQQFLRKKGVTARHETKPGPSDASKLLTFAWEGSVAAADKASRVELQIDLALLVRPGGYHFASSIKLSAQISELPRETVAELPEVKDQADIASLLAKQVESAFPGFAVEIMRATSVVVAAKEA